MISTKEILILVFIAGTGILLERRIQDAIAVFQQQIQIFVDEVVREHKQEYKQLLDKYNDLQKLQGETNDQKFDGCDKLMITGRHPENVKITASSTHPHCKNIQHYGINAKSTGWNKGNGGGWCVGDDKLTSIDQYVQVSLTKTHMFRGVVIQGRQDAPQWVTHYRVFYSNDCITYHTDGKIFSGNWDQDTINISLFDKPVRGNCIRISPTKYHGHMSMRFDVIGCEV